MQRLIPGVLAGVLAFSSMEAMAAADLLLFNGKVFTAEPGQPLVQAVAVANGKILKDVIGDLKIDQSNLEPKTTSARSCKIGSTRAEYSCGSYSRSAS